MKIQILGMLSALCVGGHVYADPQAVEIASLEYAQVTQVKATQSKDNTWCFSVQVRHNDQGWKHYADGWQVIDTQGNQLGLRVLGHPHDNEQPFTRKLCKIAIPKDIKQVVVRAKCNQHGFGGKTMLVDLYPD